MPCVTCSNWVPPEGSKRAKGVGRCRLDDQLAHGHYTCAKHTSAAAYADTAGLTDDEIEWLRMHALTPKGAELIGLYDMIRACPNDPGARGVFQSALDIWRRRHTGRDLTRERMVDDGLHDEMPPGDVACKALLTGGFECGWPECLCPRDDDTKGISAA